jgi:Outer membrane protein beta-barrel domain
MTNKKERETIAMNKKCLMVLVRGAGWFAAVLWLVCVLAGTARAQQAAGSTPQVEVSGAYSYVRANAANSGGSFNLNGGSGSLAYNFNDRFSIVADGGAYRFSGLPPGLDSTMYTYLFGPRYSFRQFGRVTPFAQALFGGGRLNASSGGVNAGENGFAMAVGGGIDVPFHRHLALRLIQAEYLLTRFDLVTGASATQNNVRISAGLVFRFGGR